MTLELVREVLGWCALINYIILILWFVVFVSAHEWMYHLHSRWFSLSKNTFDTIHYAGMAIFKLGVFLFNIVPYVALWIVL